MKIKLAAKIILAVLLVSGCTLELETSGLERSENGHALTGELKISVELKIPVEVVDEDGNDPEGLDQDDNDIMSAATEPEAIDEDEDQEDEDEDSIEEPEDNDDDEEESLANKDETDSLSEKNDQEMAHLDDKTEEEDKGDKKPEL